MCEQPSNKTVTLRKHVNKYKSMQKWMVKFLRSLVLMSRMDRVRNDEVHRGAGTERELASGADQRVLR